MNILCDSISHDTVDPSKSRKLGSLGHKESVSLHNATDTAVWFHRAGPLLAEPELTALLHSLAFSRIQNMQVTVHSSATEPDFKVSFESGRKYKALIVEPPSPISDKLSKCDPMSGLDLDSGRLRGTEWFAERRRRDCVVGKRA